MCSSYENGSPLENKKNLVENSPLLKKTITKIKMAAKNKLGVITRKFDTSQSKIVIILKKEGIKRYSRSVKPKYSEKQLLEIPLKCRKLRRKYLDDETVIAMDDEKYLIFSNSMDISATENFIRTINLTLRIK